MCPRCIWTATMYQEAFGRLQCKYLWTVEMYQDAFGRLPPTKRHFCSVIVIRFGGSVVSCEADIVFSMQQLHRLRFPTLFLSYDALVDFIGAWYNNVQQEVDVSLFSFMVLTLHQDETLVFEGCPRNCDEATKVGSFIVFFSSEEASRRRLRVVLTGSLLSFFLQSIGNLGNTN